MISAVRRVQFCAGHRILNHEGCCAHLHGHNYVAYFHAEADQLDSLGRVVDFSVLNTRLGGWIERTWDHAFILFSDDHEAREALSLVSGQRIFLLEENPSAENLAKYLLHVVGPAELSGVDVRLAKVVLWETENCSVEVTL